MTAGMAGYIFKNKLMPRREWQKDAKPKADAMNPFRILPSGYGEAAAEQSRPAPHPMMKKRFPIVLMLEPLHACNLTCTGCERIRIAKQAGFMVCTNTTVYKETDMKEIAELFQFLKQFDVDGHQLSPAYGYSAVNDREIFMTREDIQQKFQEGEKFLKPHRLN